MFGFHVVCMKCKKDADIHNQQLFDGGFTFHSKCPKCGHKVDWAVQTSAPTPPTALTRPPQQLKPNKDDMKFLQALKIAWEGA